MNTVCGSRPLYLKDAANQKTITTGFPKKEIPRRNTGYALDLLMDANPINGSEKPFNFCKLLAGSEGTLAMMTEIKLNLVPLPPAMITAYISLLPPYQCALYHSITEFSKYTRS